MTHVTVGKAIDWQQWQLDQAVRSVRMQVDRDGDLYAIPVIVVDPTHDDNVQATMTNVKTTVSQTALLRVAGTTILWPTPAGRDFYLQGMLWDYVGSAIAAGAATVYNNLQDLDGVELFQHQFWCPAAATIRPSTLVTLPEQGLRFPRGIQVVVSTATDVSYAFHWWGFEA